MGLCPRGLYPKFTAGKRELSYLSMSCLSVSPWKGMRGLRFAPLCVMHGGSQEGP